MPVLLLFFGLAAAAFTWNVYRPMGGGSRRGVLSFLAGWLTGELALHHIAWQVLVVGLLVAVGALRPGSPGRFWAVGAAIFSGTLYALALGAPRWLGAITPLGGTLLIAGWLSLAWVARRR